MPVFNGELYIEEALKSVINQTYEEFELIIIDDGSVDNTKKIIKSFHDYRIKYFYKENGGEASARNLGLNKAIGDYITYLDADDMMRRDRLEKQIEYLLMNKNLDAVYTEVNIIDENSHFVDSLSSELEIKNYKDYYPMMLCRQIIPATATLMFKRKVIESGIRYPEKYENSVDYLFALNLVKNFKLGYLKEHLYLYRRHNKNLTNNHKKQLFTEVDIIKNIGIKEIKIAINDSNFHHEEKNILLAKILLKINENEEAYKILKQIKNKDAYNYFYMGNINFEKERYIEAKYEYKKALTLDGFLAEVYNNLGVCEYMLGNKEEAKENFLKAIEINSIYMDANYNLGATGNFKITKRELRKKLTKYNT